MKPNDKLPETTQERIKADAAIATNKRYPGDAQNFEYLEYEAGWKDGATAENDRAQGMYDRLCFIRERLKQAESGKRLNYEALIYGIDHELGQWKDGKKEVDEPIANTCGICKERPCGKDITVCNECYYAFDGDRRGFWNSDTYQ